MDKIVPEQSRGIIWCNSSVTNQDEMPRQSFCNWYHDIHIPDVLQTGAISKAYRYQAVDPAEDRFHLALYYADNMDGLLDKVKSTNPLHGYRASLNHSQLFQIATIVFQDHMKCSITHISTLASTN
jgi:hypothetical protein